MALHPTLFPVHGSLDTLIRKGELNDRFVALMQECQQKHLPKDRTKLQPNVERTQLRQNIPRVDGVLIFHQEMNTETEKSLRNQDNVETSNLCSRMCIACLFWH
eukprot:scaffold48915_cov24-Cyclotella_meneghiniana.AAC.1